MVNTFWGAYATVTISLIGWVFGRKHCWSLQQKVAISLTYCLVATINCLAQLRFNGLISATLIDLKAAMGSRHDMRNLRAEMAEISTLPPFALMFVYILDLPDLESESILL